jgi:ubiquinone/menaquinone biosynthesis C-methylase UbiE
MLDDILICPKTKSRITIDDANSIAKVEGSELSYPIKDGIIDFLPDTEDRVTKAYDSFASSYDSYMSLSGWYWKLYVLIAWGLLDDKEIIHKILSSIPDDFAGVLLDVPVGTGIFTCEKYSNLNKARIIGIDYSLAMLKEARKRYAEKGIQNVTFIRGDVGNMPIQQASIDACLSMAGFHAFPNQDQALHEIARVLKHDAIFSGGFYIKGKRLLTDLVVRTVLCGKGWFTAPFYNKQECLSKFGEYFTCHLTANLKSAFYFAMNKK